ncbi:hypothetical protein [Nocardioides silvaticus]|nr:hypothetical protein [Nocardioides silvaticus]
MTWTQVFSTEGRDSPISRKSERPRSTPMEEKSSATWLTQTT